MSFQADLYHKHTNASGFTFMSKLIDTDWPSYMVVNDLIIAKHITTTKEPPSYITKKNIYKPKYMLVGKLHNHFPKPAHPANPM